MIKQLILDIKKQYAVPVCNLDNIEHIPDELIEFQMNDQLFFEVLLMEIRGKTISYATYKKKEEAKTEKELVEEIQLMEADLKHNSVPLLEEKKHQLQAIRNRRLEGMMVRSRVKWIQDGERASRYFCNLEKRDYTSRSMSFIETRDGQTIFSQKEIDETKAFYETFIVKKKLLMLI